MASPVRVNDKLYHDAETHGALQHRSTAKQVEFWAELGKRVDEFASTSDLLALMQGIAKVSIEIPRTEAIEPLDVFTAVDQSRSAGQLGQSITRNTLYYESSKGRPGLLDQVMPDGSRRTGHFNNGEFVVE